MIILYILLIAGCIVISGRLILTLWLRHGQDSGVKKMFWSLVLLIPVFGWVMYGGFHKPPGENEIKAQGGASGWHPLYK